MFRRISRLYALFLIAAASWAAFGDCESQLVAERIAVAEKTAFKKKSDASVMATTERIAFQQRIEAEDLAYNEIPDEKIRTLWLNEIFRNTFRQELLRIKAIPIFLMERAVRRFPFLPQTPFIVFISGAVADDWAKEINGYCLKQGLSCIFVQLPGEISLAQPSSTRRSIPAFTGELLDLIRKYPSIFIDDFQVGGGTAAAVRTAVNEAKGSYIGSFVAYSAASKEKKTAAIYNAEHGTEWRPRASVPPSSEFRFRPTRYDWVNKPVAIEVRYSSRLFKKERNALSGSGEIVFSIFNELRAPVKLVNDSKESIDWVKAKFPGIQWLDQDEEVSFSIDRVDKRFGHDGILDRLIDEGILYPEYNHTLWPQNNSIRPEIKIFDLRSSSERKRAPLESSHSLLIATLRLASLPKLVDSQAIKTRNFVKISRLAARALIRAPWELLTQDERNFLFEYAQFQYQHLAEAEALLPLISDSNDKRWIPTLKMWREEWMWMQRPIDSQLMQRTSEILKQLEEAQ